MNLINLLAAEGESLWSSLNLGSSLLAVACGLAGYFVIKGVVAAFTAGARFNKDTIEKLVTKEQLQKYLNNLDEARNRDNKDVRDSVMKAAMIVIDERTKVIPKLEKTVDENKILNEKIKDSIKELDEKNGEIKELQDQVRRLNNRLDRIDNNFADNSTTRRSE